MDTTTTVKGFNTLKNQILGRLSQCMDTDQLEQQLLLECLELRVERYKREAESPSREEKAALIGHDITEGIDRANQVIAGAIDDL